MHCVNQKLDFLMNNILSLFDKHAPLILINSSRKNLPWITDNIRLLQNLRDSARKKYIKSNKQEHFDYYKMLRNYTQFAIRSEKKAYLNMCLNLSNEQSVWREMRSLNIVSSRKTNNIPHNLLNLSDMNKLFTSPIVKNIPNNYLFYLSHYANKYQASKVIIMNLILLQNLMFLLYFIASNLKLLVTIILVLQWYKCVVFPTAWKVALVRPLPRATQPNTFNDLRPIAILPMLSKLCEKILETQLRAHLNKFNILPKYQSGFRPGYSCGTCLAKNHRWYYKILRREKIYYISFYRLHQSI